MKVLKIISVCAKKCKILLIKTFKRIYPLLSDFPVENFFYDTRMDKIKLQ